MDDTVVEGISWEAPEHRHTDKSSDWYWALGIIAIAAAAAALVFGNTLFVNLSWYARRQVTGFGPAFFLSLFQAMTLRQMLAPFLPDCCTSLMKSVTMFFERNIS